MQSLLDVLPPSPFDASALSASRRTALRATIDQTITQLRRVERDLDPIRYPEHVLDPSDPQVIGRLIAETLLVQPRHQLTAVPRFWGSGVYALYYKGGFATYRPATDTETPLYVGKADLQTHGAISPVEQGDKLWSRLNDHKRSILKAENLDINDLECRYLVVKSAWQGTAQTYLIRWFAPVWNDEVGVCHGIGKHGDAAATRSNTRSPWDTLHPGRAWAWAEGNKPNPLSAAQIAERISAHYTAHPPKER